MIVPRLVIIWFTPILIRHLLPGTGISGLLPARKLPVPVDVALYMCIQMKILFKDGSFIATLIALSTIDTSLLRSFPSIIYIYMYIYIYIMR